MGGFFFSTNVQKITFKKKVNLFSELIVKSKDKL